MGGIGDAIGGIIGGVGDVIGGIFGSGHDSGVENALRAQREAQEQALKLQQEQMKKNQAQMQQAQNQANKQTANAAAAIDKRPVISNPNNLTGGLGVNPDDLLLGSVASLGGGSSQKKKYDEDLI